MSYITDFLQKFSIHSLVKLTKFFICLKNSFIKFIKTFNYFPIGEFNYTFIFVILYLPYITKKNKQTYKHISGKKCVNLL